MRARTLNSIGLVLNILGVVLLFFFSYPQPTHQELEGISLRLEGNRLPSGKTITEHNEEIRKTRDAYVFGARLGLGLISLGFLFQLGAASMPEPQVRRVAQMGVETLRYRPALYLSLALVGSLSFLAAWLLEVNEVLRSLIAFPFAALFQLVRDHSSFVKDTIKQEREHAFIVAATSHMSAVVFDKHVKFSEDYVEIILDLLGNLMAAGPSGKALRYIDPLHRIRRKYRLWISPRIAVALDEFESKLIRMGPSMHVWEATREYEKGANKNLDLAYDLFSEVINERENKKEIDNVEIEQKKLRGYALVIEHLQIILGIEKLTELRDTAIASAYSRD
jgi:hypothetical protein